MFVILKKDVPSLGGKGERVKVSDGYARNHLIPRGLAVESTEGATRVFAEEQSAEKRREDKFRHDAEVVSKTLNKTVITIPVKVGEDGRLFGSVTASDVAAAIRQARKMKIDKKKIVLEENIKRVGAYSVQVRLHPEIECSLKLQVVAEGGEGS